MGQAVKIVISTTASNETLNDKAGSMFGHGNDLKIADENHLKVACDNSLLGKVKDFSNY